MKYITIAFLLALLAGCKQKPIATNGGIKLPATDSIRIYGTTIKNSTAGVYGTTSSYKIDGVFYVGNDICVSNIKINASELKKHLNKEGRGRVAIIGCDIIGDNKGDTLIMRNAKVNYCRFFKCSLVVEDTGFVISNSQIIDAPQGEVTRKPIGYYFHSRLQYVGREGWYIRYTQNDWKDYDDIHQHFPDKDKGIKLAKRLNTYQKCLDYNDSLSHIHDMINIY